MIVIDANVFIYSMINGEKSEAARAVLDAEPEWIAPFLLKYEFMNTLATWNRKKIMGMLECQKTWRRAIGLMEGNLVEPDLITVLNLSLVHAITAYDAQYVQLAVSRELSLVTEDRELLGKFSHCAFSMDDFLKRPHGN